MSVSFLVFLAFAFGYGFGHWFGGHKPWKGSYWPIWMLMIFVLALLLSVAEIYW